METMWGLLYGGLYCVNFGSEIFLSFNVGGLSPNIIGRTQGADGGASGVVLSNPTVIGLAMLPPQGGCYRQRPITRHTIPQSIGQIDYDYWSRPIIHTAILAGSDCHIDSLPYWQAQLTGITWRLGNAKALTSDVRGDLYLVGTIMPLELSTYDSAEV